MILSLVENATLKISIAINIPMGANCCLAPKNKKAIHENRIRFNKFILLNLIIYRIIPILNKNVGTTTPSP